jgi:Uncharacterized enzyme of heme biosynthesis
VRKLLIILSVALLLGAAGYQVLARIDGYLLLSAGPYVVETSLWGALILVILFLVSLWFLWRLWCLLILPRHWWQRIVGRKIVKDRNQTVQGILDYLDGNWPKAVENLRKGVKRSETPALNYLGAAAASFNLGDEKTSMLCCARLRNMASLMSLRWGCYAPDYFCKISSTTRRWY